MAYAKKTSNKRKVNRGAREIGIKKKISKSNDEIVFYLNKIKEYKKIKKKGDLSVKEWFKKNILFSYAQIMRRAMDLNLDY